MLQYKSIEEICINNQIEIVTLLTDELELFPQKGLIVMSLPWKRLASEDDNFFEMVLCIGQAIYSKRRESDYEEYALEWAIKTCGKYGVKISLNKKNEITKRFHTEDGLIDRITMDHSDENLIGSDIYSPKNIAEDISEDEYVTIEDGEILLTKEQQACVDYVGDKNKNLAVRSCPGGGKTLVLVERAKEYLKEVRLHKKKNSIAVFTHNLVLANYLKELIGVEDSDKDYIRIGKTQEFINEVYYGLSENKYAKLGNKAFDAVKGHAMDGALRTYADKINNDKYVKWGKTFWFEEFAWMRNMNIFDSSDEEAYFRLKRDGRGHTHAMKEVDRQAAFEMFITYQDIMRRKKVFDGNPDGNERALFVTHNTKKIPSRFFYDHVLIDEAQDQTLTNVIALRALAKEDLTICMDLNQRIYKNRWKLSQAVSNITSKLLTHSFRTTRQIDIIAEDLIAKNDVDFEENEKSEHKVPTDAVGEKPEVIQCSSESEEILFTTETIKRWIKADPKHTIGIMCFTNDAVDKVAGWLSKAGIPFQYISGDEEAVYSIVSPGVKICTMHNSKGLEFTRVILPQFYEGMIPRSWAYKDEDELIRMRSTAYVAMTRAMHQLVIVYNGHKSQFIKEINPELYNFVEYSKVVAEMNKKVSLPEPRKIEKKILSDAAIEKVKQNRRSKWSLTDDTE